EEFRKASAAHVDEAGRLRAAVSEQSALVSELEESLAAAEAKVTSAEAELDRLRRAAGEAEEADRSRRSRLAELEGKLLRLERGVGAELAQAQAGRALAESAAKLELGGGADAARLERLAATLPRLGPVEETLRRQVEALVDLERTIAATGVQAQKNAKEEAGA